MAQSKSVRRPAARSAAPPTPALEWAMAALGLVLLLGVIAVLLADAFGGRNGAPPAIAVNNLGVVRTPAGWVVEFEARNASRRPAAEVPVTGVLSAGGVELERRTATLDYLPGGGVSRGGLVFRNEPAGGTLELSADGYREP